MGVSAVNFFHNRESLSFQLKIAISAILDVSHRRRVVRVSGSNIPKRPLSIAHRQSGNLEDFNNSAYVLMPNLNLGHKGMRPRFPQCLSVIFRESAEPD